MADHQKPWARIPHNLSFERTEADTVDISREEECGRVFLDFGGLHGEDDPVLHCQNLRLGVNYSTVLFGAKLELGTIVADEVLLAVGVLLSEAFDEELGVATFLGLLLQVVVGFLHALGVDLAAEHLEVPGYEQQLFLFCAGVLEVELDVPDSEHDHGEAVEEGGLGCYFLGLDVDVQFGLVLGEDVDDLHVGLVRVVAEQAEELEEVRTQPLDFAEELA